MLVWVSKNLSALNSSAQLFQILYLCLQAILTMCAISFQEITLNQLAKAMNQLLYQP